MASNRLRSGTRKVPERKVFKITVTVRWWDGYLETFKASEVRFGSDLLWLKIKGSNRHIPLRQVRWFSMTPGSHEPRRVREQEV